MNNYSAHIRPPLWAESFPRAARVYTIRPIILPLSGGYGPNRMDRITLIGGKVWAEYDKPMVLLDSIRSPLWAECGPNVKKHGPNNF